jgi:hypothetical protein
MEIDERYDIKGATYKRQTLANDDQTYNKNVALKDVDLINNHNRIFDIEISQK